MINLGIENYNWKEFKDPTNACNPKNLAEIPDVSKDQNIQDPDILNKVSTYVCVVLPQFIENKLVVDG
ncbi:hypothetical protein QE152_g4681 [Popillia japonica]|uniref:Uncharacterized protein n=1 Tax=Popillia japonica TaxID=7064 RepID=A0AAW1MTL1_POPJA